MLKLYEDYVAGKEEKKTKKWMIVFYITFGAFAPSKNWKWMDVKPSLGVYMLKGTVAQLVERLFRI